MYLGEWFHVTILALLNDVFEFIRNVYVQIDLNWLDRDKVLNNIEKTRKYVLSRCYIFNLHVPKLKIKVVSNKLPAYFV